MTLNNLTEEEEDLIAQRRKAKRDAQSIEDWRRETKEECRALLKTPYGKKLLRDMKDIGLAEDKPKDI